jgi:hypothetical protein
MDYFIIFLVAMLVGYVLGVFTWPSLRAWFKNLVEHPEETIKADIAALQERLRKLRGGP